MKPQAPEFHRPLEIARVPPDGSAETLAAEPDECAALARRLGLHAVISLAATLDVMPWRRKGAKVTGAVRAEIVQTCVVSLDDFTASVREPVERYYLPPGLSTGAEDEDDADEIVNGVVDLGELVSETLALSIDPYPRKPGVAFQPAAEPDGPSPVSPFTALAKAMPKRT